MSETRKNYVVLIAMNAKNAAAGQEMRDRLLAVDATAKIAWIDAHGIGMFVSAAMTARELALKALPEGRPQREREALRDMLILQIGPDHWCRSESAVDGWLNSHRRSV